MLPQPQPHTQPHTHTRPLLLLVPSFVFALHGFLQRTLVCLHAGVTHLFSYCSSCLPLCLHRTFSYSVHWDVLRTRRARYFSWYACTDKGTHIHTYTYLSWHVYTSHIHTRIRHAHTRAHTHSIAHNSWAGILVQSTRAYAYTYTCTYTYT
jgi:hypothetical protein